MQTRQLKRLAIHTSPEASLSKTAGEKQRLSEDLTNVYRLCNKITRANSRSFYFSSALLPGLKRQSARVLYAFCRLSDEIVDGPDGSSPTERLSRLDAWQEELRRPIGEETHPVLRAWADVRQRFDIPLRYSEELLQGMRADLCKTRYETFEELWQYCYYAASTVGFNTMYLIGFDDQPDTFRKAEQLGVALQLTNILRDVGEDWRRGRIYLPQEDLHRFAYTEADMAQGIIDERYKALIDFEIERANALYDAAWPGIGYLHPDGRLAIATAAEVYRGILKKIIANGYDNFRQRAHLKSWEKLALLPKIWRRAKALPE